LLKRFVRLLIVVILGIAGAFYAGLLRLNFPSPERFPVRGIDVSHHQGHISWFEASLHGVKFAYIKATEGTDYRDSGFLYNWQQCPYNQIARGAYHFFNFCTPGRAQARNFLAVVPADPHALPPAIDLEFSRNCRHKPNRAVFKHEVTAFMREISPRFPRPPVLYVSEEVYRRYLEGHRQEYPPHLLWIVDVVKTPRLAPCAEWIFWQYAAFGKVPGVRGPTDQNVFCGTPEEFARLTNS
jgi:lysozyme